MQQRINPSATGEDVRLRTVLIAAGVGLAGVAVLVSGLCAFLAVVAHGGDRLPIELTMAVGLIVGLGGMVAIPRSPGFDR